MILAYNLTSFALSFYDVTGAQTLNFEEDFFCTVSVSVVQLLKDRLTQLNLLNSIAQRLKPIGASGLVDKHMENRCSNLRTNFDRDEFEREVLPFLTEHNKKLSDDYLTVKDACQMDELILLYDTVHKIFAWLRKLYSKPGKRINETELIFDKTVKKRSLMLVSKYICKEPLRVAISDEGDLEALRELCEDPDWEVVENTEGTEACVLEKNTYDPFKIIGSKIIDFSMIASITPILRNADSASPRQDALVLGKTNAAIPALSQANVPTSDAVQYYKVHFSSDLNCAENSILAYGNKQNLMTLWEDGTTISKNKKSRLASCLEDGREYTVQEALAQVEKYLSENGFSNLLAEDLSYLAAGRMLAVKGNVRYLPNKDVIVRKGKW